MNTWNNRRNRFGGFTLIEMLVVIAVIMILMSLVLYGYASVRMRSRIQAAQTDIVTIKKAIENYHSLYHLYPVPDPTSPKVFDPLNPPANMDGYGIFTATNAEVIDLLTTSYSKEAILELKASSIVNDGSFIDKWGQPYIIQIMCFGGYKHARKESAAGTGDTTHDYWAKTVKGNINVYSMGPNKQDELGYAVRDGNQDLSAGDEDKIDPVPPPLFPAAAGAIVDDLIDQGLVDDVRETR